MGNPIICSECKCKMHLIKNWGNIYTGDSHGAYFETFTLFAYRMKNAFMKGIGFKKVKPKMYVCQQCGKFEMYFDNEDIQSIIDIDNDSDYESKNSVSENSENEERPVVNLTRMRKRALDRKKLQTTTSSTATMQRTVQRTTMQ